MLSKQPRQVRRAAAWAAPIVQQIKEHQARKAVRLDEKRTHKLPSMECVLWLPDYGGYVKSVNHRCTAFTVSRSPSEALRLNDDQAEVTGQDLAIGAGVRVHLRACAHLS
jgi:hypothetical protein